MAFIAGALLRFYTKEESEAWLSDRQRQKPDLRPDVRVEPIEYPSEPYRVFFFAHWVSSELTYRRPTLLFITEWGSWPSSENWHLYYKLRKTYGDNRLLHEAPGHLFLEHEAEDLASFLQLSYQHGRLTPEILFATYAILCAVNGMTKKILKAIELSSKQ
jgi:hypothetical protein